MRNRTPTFNDDQHWWVRQWHGAMRRGQERDPKLPGELRQLGLGDRARLRRARSRIELASDPATMALVAGLVKRAKDGRLRDEPENYERLGIVAGVLAYVESDERTPEGRVAKAGGRAVPTFAANLAQSARSDGPAMSELRFRQLRAATDPDDLLRLWRRALHLAGRRADVASLADDLYTWLIEIENGEASPMNSARFQWAWDYYRQSRDENHSEPTPTPEVKE